MRDGFTLFETIVVIAILGLLAGTLWTLFSGPNFNPPASRDATLLISILNQARSLTLGSKDNTQYGLHFENSRVVLFRGDSYVASDPFNVSSELNAAVSISEINLSGGGTEVVFERLTGKTEQNGSISISLNADPAVSKTITIHESGLSEIN